MRTFTGHFFLTLLTALALPSLVLAQTMTMQQMSEGGVVNKIPVRGSGYVWANNPTASNYTPDPVYSYNSTGGAVRISRSSVGTYAVQFTGFGGRGQPGGNVQVTAYGRGTESCKVASWDSGGADFIVNVHCFLASGKPVDTRYSATVIWPGSRSATNRSINEQGFIEIDGKTVPKTVYANVQPATPPSIPDNTQRPWLEEHSQALHGIIASLVGNDPTSIANYDRSEGNSDIYAKILKRTETIDDLLSPSW